MYKIALLLVIVICFVFVPDLVAQPGLPPTPDQAPLGGVALLTAAGGAYARHKLRKCH